METYLYLQCPHCLQFDKMKLLKWITDNIKKEEEYHFIHCGTLVEKKILHGKKLEPREEFGDDPVL